MKESFIGIDVGAETIKIARVSKEEDKIQLENQEIIEHHNEPGASLLELIQKFDWNNIQGAAVTGRFSRVVNLPRIPAKQAQAAGFRYLFGDKPATLVSIGSHGFSVLELRKKELEVFRSNSRCSQGTGNFLRQLVERFNMNIDEASKVCEDIEEPAPLSGRCPVILKTDMTHLANKGESRPKILAGLYDAVCENVQVLIKPGISPKEMLLIGGVSRSKRVRDRFNEFSEKNEMQFIEAETDKRVFIESIGAAVYAASGAGKVTSLDDLILDPEEVEMEKVAGLSSHLSKVKRMPKQQISIENSKSGKLIIGFDIGSTGSKAVAVDPENKETVWEGYINTNGNPVGAAQTLMKQFIDGPAGKLTVVGLSATGSGREIVGSLMTTCYGKEQIYVLNEIAAHAEGALHFDNRVDTIFEIGGQDAKYIRLSDGKIVDAAMNEACSAGTGSFIEEQGKKFSKVENVVQLGQEALKADCGVSLGQHCSVFMAEIIDEAVAAGVENKSIIAGIYDSIIQNYCNRVKGSRSVGDVIFCQGMPFAADALAGAVVAQTGSEVIIPPNPGTVGALGIALLAKKALDESEKNLEALDPQKFLSASIESKDTFVCSSNKGCGGAGNKCRIDRIATIVAGSKQKFTWGGGCSMWDKGTRVAKLPDRTPDPFREREELIEEILANESQTDSMKTIALTDEFSLKGLFPYFITFFRELGFAVKPFIKASHSVLKKGIKKANIPFCAPMQMYHGFVNEMAEAESDYIFLPMLKSIYKAKNEPSSCVCPIVQGSSDIMKWDIGKENESRVLTSVIDMNDGNLDSKLFQDCVQSIAQSLGINGKNWQRAHEKAAQNQKEFDKKCIDIGNNALAFCRENNITPILVHGRPYTIYNKVLNSNVPAILREQGCVAIPIDCYEIKEEVPVFEDMFWGQGQRNLRASHQVRRTDGIYSIWCSNYSCGPDSFNLHFFSYIMQGKPFAVIETDGHSGDAGTKTRVEAFLHCVKEDMNRIQKTAKEPADFKTKQRTSYSLKDIRETNATVIIPRMGVGATALTACLRSVGIDAEALDMPNHETVRIGRRFTSGKECLPMTVTAGSLIDRVEKEPDKNKKFAFFMPTAEGPCRFGMYNNLHKIILERKELNDRVEVWSPNDSDYFDGLPTGFSVLTLTAFAAEDMLQAALYDVRPVESEKGAAKKIYDKYRKELHKVLEAATKGTELSGGNALMHVANRKLFGVNSLLKKAAKEFAKIKTDKKIPRVSMVGEIYVRCDDFSNDFLVDKLEARGVGVIFAPFTEWLEYTDHFNIKEGRSKGFDVFLNSFVLRRVQSMLYNVFKSKLKWHKRTEVKESLKAAEPYIRGKLNGEAVLTLGGPLHEWREGQIDGVVSAGPHECMPTKIAEAQFFHVAEKEGLLSLTIPYNGDPIDIEIIENFAFEVKSRFQTRMGIEYDVAEEIEEIKAERKAG
ncbi:MAG: acyl-CoA dehydratase activase-related protein [Spirochaetia bacterium]|nr:acyl-CoA dehydratase activase-related protein [Spirochaetia bacterium]